MTRRLLIAVVVTFLTVGTFIGSPRSATAATQDYSSAQTEQSYSGQSEYDKRESTDYSYTDKQTNQAKPQEKQSYQSDDKQYAQQEQSYQKK